jgi:hypothetical protein
MKKYLYYMIATLFLTGCINFNPNGNKVETSAEETSVDLVEDSADELAMQNSPHLKFKNVPIDGTLDKFVARMVKSGFKKERKTADQAILSGDFAGFKECVVYVETLTGKDLVSRIAVSFPDREQWEYLYGDYKHLKELLVTKYGKPSSCVEKFQGSYGLIPTDDNDRMHYVRFDKCKYETRFTSDKGEIVLWIEHDGVSSTFVMLAYKDKINGSVIKNHAIDDL